MQLVINTVLARRGETMYSCLKVSFPSDRSSLFRRVGWDPNDSCFPRVEELVLDITLRSENISLSDDDLPQCQLNILLRTH